MIFFFITFFSLYGFVYLYFFLKLKKFIPINSTKYLIPITVFLFIMWLSPFLIRMLERNSYHFLAEKLAWIGYIWMGFIALFFFFSLSLDIFSFLLKPIGKLISLDMSKLRFFPRTFFFISLILAMMLVIYGYFEAMNIKVKKIQITSSKINQDLKIVQISDMHLGLIVSEKRSLKVVENIKKLRPDLLISTGDLVDGQLDKIENLAYIFKEIDVPFGKYAILGNHEVYAGLQRSLKFTEMSGFKILRQDSVYIPELNLNIIGVDDEAVELIKTYEALNKEAVLIKKLSKTNSFNLFLRHRPFINDEIQRYFDLQLSGHTHKGQFFPFSLITKIYYLNDSGLVKLSSGAYLYTSNGTGTWGPPIRILAPPEITLIEIKKSL